MGRNMTADKQSHEMPSKLTLCDRERLLIVDDDAVVRRTFHTILSSGLPDLKIDLAVDGTEAVELFRDAHHGIILMDIYLPLMNGLEAYAQIERQCEISKWEMPRIVFCSGFFPSVTLKEVVEQNPEHCILHKPVKNELLIKTIQERTSPAGTEQ